MSDPFSRTRLLLGEKAMKVLAESRVAVFGVGGVGGYVVEALARSGVGALDIVDNDRVAVSNLNRQIIATRRTIGQYKTDVMRERILEINPDAAVHSWRCFYLPETRDLFDFTRYSYVVDAVDTVTAKIQLVLEAREAGVPIISCMGAGNKLNPAGFEVADIYETSVCPLARVMRRELRKRGVEKLKVVYSREEPVRPAAEAKDDGQEKAADGLPGQGDARRKAVPGSAAFVPSVAGLILAGEVIKDLVSAADGRA